MNNELTLRRKEGNVELFGSTLDSSGVNRGLPGRLTAETPGQGTNSMCKDRTGKSKCVQETPANEMAGVGRVWGK